MATETTTPVQQNPPSKLRKVYDFLVSQNKVRPGRSFEEFEERMQDPARLEKVFNYLKESNKVRAENFDQFQDSMGLKKKEQAFPGGVPMAPQPDPQSVQLVDQPQVSGEISSPVLESGLTEEQERERNLAELEKYPVANEQQQQAPKPRPMPFVTGPDTYSPIAHADNQQRMQQPPRQLTPEEIEFQKNRERNPLVSFGKSVWNIASNVLPSAAASTLGIMAEGSNLAQMPETVAPGTKAPTIDETRQMSQDAKARLLEYAHEQNLEGADYMKNIVNTMDKVSDPIDALNYVFAAVGQAAGQIPLSVATGGGSSIMQEVGSIYYESVNRIAQERGISIRDVISQGLDEPAYALAYGTTAGTLDRFGAGKIMGAFKSPALKQAMRSRALTVATSTGVEGTTEYAQTWLEQIGSLQGAERSFTEALTEIVNSPEMLKEQTEGFVQGLIGGSALSGAGIGASAIRQRIQDRSRPEPQTDAPQPGPDAGSYTFTGPKNATVPSPDQDNTRQQTPSDQTQPVSTAGPGQDIQNLKRSAPTVQGIQSTSTGEDSGSYTAPSIQEQQPADDQTQVIPPTPAAQEQAEQQIAPSEYDGPPRIEDITDPEELAGMYLEEVRNPSVLGSDLAIAEVLDGGLIKIQREGFVRYNDAANITPGMAKSYFSNKGSTIDQISEEASERSGLDITPGDVADFMIRYKSGPSTISTPAGNPKLAEIANRFSELTGKGINRRTAKIILEKAAKMYAEAAKKDKINQSIVDNLANNEPVDFDQAHDEIVALLGLSEEEYIFLKDNYGRRPEQQESEESSDERRYDLIPDAQEETAELEGGTVQERFGRSPEDREALIQEIKSKPLTHVSGLNMGSGVAKGTYLSTEDNNRYASSESQVSSAEVDISSPRLFTEDDDVIGYRNTILAEHFSSFEDTDFESLAKPPSGSTISIDDLSGAGVDKLAGFVRSQLEAEGYDSIYFQESVTQEGELVVFDRNKVKLTPTKPTDTSKPSEDLDGIVKHNSKRKKPLGIVGDPANGFMFMTDLGDKVVDTFKKYFRSRGFLPKDVFNRWIQAKGEISKWENQIKFTVSDLKKAVKDDYGKDKLTDDQVTDLNLYLQGKQNVNPIPPNTMAVLDTMRAQIDHLSQRFIDEGIISGDLTAAFTQNLGVYLTRSYRKHDDPFWAEFVDPQVRNKAEAFIRNNAAKKGQQITPEEVDGLINFILHDPNAPMAVLKGSKLGSKDLSVLKKRGDIAPEIRALMGEYSDPLLNYARSVTKMINIIAKHHFLNDVKANGMGKFLFDKPTGKHHVPLAAEGSKTMAPLNGLYTTKEIADAFNEFNSQDPMGPWMRAYMKAVSWVKANKTIFSVQTHARNVVGNLGFVIMNGHWRVNEAGKAAQIAWAQTYNSSQAIRDKYLEYVELGVVQDSASGGELRAYIRDIRDGKDFFETLGQRSMAKASRRLLEGVQTAYQAEDDMFKIYAYENEFARYRKAYPNKPVEQVKRMAADIVRNTYPTYSLVPKAIQTLRVNPLVGTFVSFPAEVFRTTYNTMELSAKEMGNPETRDIGVLRAAGILSTFLLPTAASMFSMYVNGLDWDDDEDLRKFVAPWQKDSEFIYLNADGDKYTVIDLGYSDPHNYLKRPIYQFLEGGPLLESGIESAASLARPFIDENMLTERLVDIHRNKKATGDHVYNPDAPLGDRISAVYSHLYPVTEPGTMVSLRRVVKGIRGEVDKGGHPYDPMLESLSIFSGQRQEIKDVTNSLLYRAYELKDRIDATDKDYFRVERNKESTPEQIQNAARIREEATQRIVEDAKDIYLSAIRLGVNPKEARRAMTLTKSEKIWRATAGAKK